MSIHFNHHNKMSVLDRTTLTGLGGASGSASPLVARVIALYRQEAEKLVRGIEAALSAANPDTLSRSAHTLKSSSASIGALALAQVARQIEQLARQARLGEAQALGAALRAEFTQLLDELAIFEQQPRSGSGDCVTQ